ncbi:MAG: 30S ribosomal protein S6 [Deltaproteobacteria bacterium]|nr:30S ribosomal protein S6 [Deltaproteobacteria bacterium]
MYFRRYETYILLSPNLMADQLEAFKDKIQGILTKGEAQVVTVEEKGRLKLAYPVNKEYYGFYILYDYRGKPEVANELERNLKIDEQVFKYLTIVLDKNFTQEKYQTVLDNIANEAAKKEKSQQSHGQVTYQAGQSPDGFDADGDLAEEGDDGQSADSDDSYDSEDSSLSDDHEDLTDEEPVGETN